MELDERLERISDREHGDGIVLYGPRGNGKTVLLGELLKKAKKRNVTSRSLTTDVMLCKDEIVAHCIQTGDDPPKRVVKKAEARALNVGGETEFEQSQPLAIAVALRTLLKKKPVLIVVDEAHVMPPKFGRKLLQTVQKMIVEGLPLLLVLAGTPGVRANLRKAGASFWERSTKLRIGRLESKADIGQAFAVPAKDSGMPMDGAALALLVRESQGYPYFIQLQGAFAWKAAARRNASRIELRDAQAGLVRADAARTEFYQERHDEAGEHGVLGAATAVSRAMLARDANQVLRNRELAEILGKAVSGTGQSPESIKERLVNLGFIWRRTDGSWEAGIPSLCSYFVEQDEE